MTSKEEIEQLANKRYLQKAEAITDSTIKGFIVSATKGGFIDGYNQCQEDNKEKKYTEEDMRRCFYHNCIDDAMPTFELYQSVYLTDC
jgi:hypothetical protein